MSYEEKQQNIATYRVYFQKLYDKQIRLAIVFYGETKRIREVNNFAKNQKNTKKKRKQKTESNSKARKRA